MTAPAPRKILPPPTVGPRTTLPTQRATRRVKCSSRSAAPRFACQREKRRRPALLSCGPDRSARPGRPAPQQLVALARALCHVGVEPVGLRYAGAPHVRRDRRDPYGRSDPVGRDARRGARPRASCAARHRHRRSDGGRTRHSPRICGGCTSRRPRPSGVQSSSSMVSRARRPRSATWPARPRRRRRGGQDPG
jgi:hypothetical protein